jgi:ABC-type bacteriocin/lantibiotic exporter with double-glycine peptidase domain
VTIEIKNNKVSALSILKRTSSHVSSKRKREIKFVFFLSVLSTLGESVSIAMLIPFISFFINPESYIPNSFLQNFFDFFNVSNQKDILFIISIIFISIVLLSSLIKLKFIKFSNLLTNNLTSDFRIKLFKFLINQDFSYYFKYGSNEVLSNIFQKSGSFTTIIFASINIINSILISLGVITVLIFNEPLYTPLIILLIILFFLIIFKIKAASVLKKGQNINLNQNFMIEIFQNTIGYLPEIIIYNVKNFFSNTLSKLSSETASALSSVRTIAMSPRVYLETFVIILVVLVIYLLDFNERSIELNISYLAILAFGAQKCLPLINSIYNLSISFRQSSPIVNSFLKILEKENTNEIQDEEQDILKFEKSIKLENLSFRYDKNLPNIINKFSFNILKGEKVAIKGKTGSGKSTLANIIAGLLNPTQGRVFVDDTLIDSENLKGWQKNLAIVPQIVFLNDATIKENIALAVQPSAIDIEKVRNSAKNAQIDEFINSLPNKYNEKVGERGIRLSGGQRQRIGIARAIYRSAKVIILDEPTNALDIETEKLVMDSISKLNKDITLVMISHSDRSLKYFDKIINLDKH